MIPIQHTYSRESGTYITTDYFNFLRDNDLLVDASEGGLIQGPSKAEGGITIIGCNRGAELFISGQAEGWQFLVNAFAGFENQAVVGTMAKQTIFADFAFRPYAVPGHINVLEVKPKRVNGQLMTPVLYHSTNYMDLIPKVPARDNLAFLDTINRECWLKHVVEKQPQPTIRDSAVLARFGAGSGLN